MFNACTACAAEQASLPEASLHRLARTVTQLNPGETLPEDTISPEGVVGTVRQVIYPDTPEFDRFIPQNVSVVVDVVVVVVVVVVDVVVVRMHMMGRCAACR